MKIGVPKETAANERRVAVTPEVAGRLVKAGLGVQVEHDAGKAASFPDEAYGAAGATVVASAADIFAHSDVVLKVQAPSPPEVHRCREGAVLVAVFQPSAEREAVSQLGARKVTAFSLALLPRITRAQPIDVRPAVKEQVESLGDKFLDLEIAQHAETAGGYAKELSEDTHRRELEFIAQHVKDADIVVTTAAIPGKRAPTLITAAAVRAMKPGSVIVDLAVETGGNCELAQPGKDVIENGVAILGPLNVPSTVAYHASQMYARNISSFLLYLVKDGALRLDFEDEIVRDTCVTHAGEVRKT